MSHLKRFVGRRAPRAPPLAGKPCLIKLAAQFPASDPGKRTWMSNSTYSARVSSVQGGLGVLLLDANGLVRQSNGVANTILGLAKGNGWGKDVSTILPEAADAVEKCRKLGTTQPWERGGAVSLIGEVTRLGQGSPGGSLVVSFQKKMISDDVSEFETPDVLRREVRTIFDVNHDGLWIINGAGFIVNVNHAAETLSGIKASELVGRHVDEIEERGIVDVSLTKQVLQQREQVSMWQYTRRTGRRIFATGTPSFDDNGELSFIVVNQRDETELQKLGQELERAKQINAMFQEELAVRNALDAAGETFVAQSPEMREVLRVALKLAKMGVSGILILGESGTGKGQLAKFIHEHSNRRDRPFTQINCAALPESVLESELFGYERGAFTGARSEGKPGLLELAEGGTLFLDEIGDMPFSIQAKVLKYLDDQEIRRLGGTRSRVVECSVIAATNHDLAKLVREKKFRQDLFYRLNSFTLRMRPLRDRPDDILPLAFHFLKKYNAKFKTRKRLSPALADAWARYSFPGNVRELEGLIKNAVVMAHGDVLDPSVCAFAAAPVPRSGDVSGAAAGGGWRERIETLEKTILAEVAAQSANTREMARRLGIDQSTVVRKMRRYGVRPPGRRQPEESA